MFMKNYTSRRSFLQTGAASVAAGAFTIIAPQSVRGTQANSKISVGLIGAGNRGSYIAGIAHADPRAQVTALCDRFPDQFEKAQRAIKVENPRTFADYEKLLAAPDIDAVFIATPPFEHRRMFEAAVQARKHIYLEKPIGVDVDGCTRTLAAAKKADPSKTIAVGFQLRYSPEYLEAFKRIQKGDLGEIVSARGYVDVYNVFQRKPYSDPAEEKLRNWFCYRDYSGDFIVEQDCHLLDVLQWFIGGVPLSVVGRGSKKFRKDWEILDNLAVVYVWPNDLNVNFTANQISPLGYFKAGGEFMGTKGLIFMSPDKMVHQKGSKPTDFEEMVAKREMTHDAVENFLDRIVTNNPENAIERAVRSNCIALLGREAVYTGREVTWKSYIGMNL
jgi:predicted dehydrogenase